MGGLRISEMQSTLGKSMVYEYVIRFVSREEQITAPPEEGKEEE